MLVETIRELSKRQQDLLAFYYHYQQQVKRWPCVQITRRFPRGTGKTLLKASTVGTYKAELKNMGLMRTVGRDRGELTELGKRLAQQVGAHPDEWPVIKHAMRYASEPAAVKALKKGRKKAQKPKKMSIPVQAGDENKGLALILVDRLIDSHRFTKMRMTAGRQRMCLKALRKLIEEKWV